MHFVGFYLLYENAWSKLQNCETCQNSNYFKVFLCCLGKYEVVTKMFRTGAAIYTAVVAAQAPVPTGQTVNSGFYCDVSRRLRENLRRRPELCRE
jgi:hypothetical protein